MSTIGVGVFLVATHIATATASYSAALTKGSSLSFIASRDDAARQFYHRPRRMKQIARATSVSNMAAKNDNVTATSGIAAAPFPDAASSTSPFLALITEADSCDDDIKMTAALNALKAAVSARLVDLVSVRIAGSSTGTEPVAFSDRDASSPLKHDMQLKTERVEHMVRQLVQWSRDLNRFKVVVSSDWIQAGIHAGAHGVHFKEGHQDLIASARQLYRDLYNDSHLLVGTSTHSVESALKAWCMHQPDYFFAGTCFATLSHPEKIHAGDLEGPTLPAQVVRALEQEVGLLRADSDSDSDSTLSPITKKPAVLAIGGLDESNCRLQVTPGYYVANAKADGIATIRAVLCAPDPAQAVYTIKHNMMDGASTS